MNTLPAIDKANQLYAQPARFSHKKRAVMLFLMDLMDSGKSIKIDNGGGPVEYPPYNHTFHSGLEDMVNEALACDSSRIYGQATDGSPVVVCLVLDYAQPLNEVISDHTANEATERLVKRHFG